MPATTTATTPAAAHRLWQDAFNARDVDMLLDLYEDDAALLSEPGGSLLHGTQAMREVLSQFVASGAEFTIERTEALESGDLAIVYSQWRLSGGAGPDGNPLDLSGETTDVLRRGEDGVWRFAIDNPWGVRAWS